MRSLKNHISLIIPLFAILFAVEFYFVIDRLIKEYETNLTDDYSIIVVSKLPLSLKEVKALDPNVSSIEEIDSNLVIKRLGKRSVLIDPQELKTFLPKFYKVFLNSFPTKYNLENLKKKLLRIDGVTRVETFMKVHEKIYRFLVFVKNISKLFLIIISITSIMLVFKQIEVWNLEHQERMYIMALFGAPLWMRNAILVKLSIIDTLISVLLVYGLYYYLVSSGSFSKLLGIEELSIDHSSLLFDQLWLFLIGLTISIINIIIVSTRQYRVS